ncbi:MAG TPA: glycosyltransferase family 1 protein, partial [Rhodocyclaceae bacterium]|nr:glycosyltransferase family 1 protein [Rhodocyclaceae bacterium]
AEFVEAARILRAANSQIEFRVVGFLDVKNPSAVPRQEVASWQAAGLIRYLGATDDVVPVFAQADCVVLPSYREGTPRCLLEASAMGIPVIATDVAGCRHVVEDGVTGLLCAPRDARDLSEKMQRMLALAPEARRRMGDAGRRKMEREFDESVVIGRYLSTIEQVLQQPAVSG